MKCFLRLIIFLLFLTRLSREINQNKYAICENLLFSNTDCNEYCSETDHPYGICVRKIFNDVCLCFDKPLPEENDDTITKESD
uniref:Invertebrate defensins family profile domain-containing protein n=1 Tax=Strongyloides papillosus TaxID=174720 RepID=A0A0N5BKA4_STREA